MISSVLEVLEYAFTLSPNDDGDKNSLRLAAIEVTSNLLTLPTPSTVQMHTFTLLAALHGSKSQYHAHKVNKTIFTFIFQQFYQCGLIFHFFIFQDQVLLKHVFESLKEMRATTDRRNIDAENFYRLVLIIRSIAIARPHNLAKFTEQNCTKLMEESSSNYQNFKT